MRRAVSGFQASVKGARRVSVDRRSRATPRTGRPGEAVRVGVADSVREAFRRAQAVGRRAIRAVADDSRARTPGAAGFRAVGRFADHHGVSSSDPRPGRTRFASAYTDRGLLDAVRSVALHAQPADPARVTKPRFDGARAAAGHGELPSAARIVRRLWAPWALTLQRALSAGDPAQWLSGRARAAEQREAGIDDVRHCLRVVVAARLGAPPLTPGEYRARARAPDPDRPRPSPPRQPAGAAHRPPDHPRHRRRLAARSQRRRACRPGAPGRGGQAPRGQRRRSARALHRLPRRAADVRRGRALRQHPRLRARTQTRAVDPDRRRRPRRPSGRRALDARRAPPPKARSTSPRSSRPPTRWRPGRAPTSAAAPSAGSSTTAQPRWDVSSPTPPPDHAPPSAATPTGRARRPTRSRTSPPWTDTAASPRSTPRPSSAGVRLSCTANDRLTFDRPFRRPLELRFAARPLAGDVVRLLVPANSRSI